MSVEAERWKEKYLQLLEQQEQVEQRWEQRVDLLRRSLVRSSLVVEGADPAVERCLQQMREVLREGDLDDGLSTLVPRLEKAALDSDRQRQERTRRLAEALHGLVNQLLAMSPPNEIRKPLKRFAKQLDQRAARLRELPALLGELSELQRRALVAQGHPAAVSGGFLRRLFGNRETLSLAAEHGQAADAPELPGSPDADDESVHVGLPPQAEAQTAGDGPTAAPAPDDLSAAAEPSTATELANDELAPQPLEDLASALPDAPEPAYSVVAERVEAALNGLLDGLHLPEPHQAQAVALRERIQRGLNWYELVPVLDDLAVLLLAVSDRDQHEFESFLQTLNARLVAMQENLIAAHDGHAETQRTAEALDSELREQVDGLHSSMRQATDLPSLKRVVEARLDGLLQTVDAYQQQRSEHERELGERLQQLTGRVGSLEQAAQGLRGHLEEQRQKALLDSLTGLPNRAAWNERLTLEAARWQRYGGDLLLAVVDVDHFKRINDGYGHLAGDRVLKIIGSELQKRLRKTDFIARFGGEEFVLLLPATSIDAGLKVLEALRSGIDACPFHFKGERVQITFSAGLSAFASGDTPEQVFERADLALYRAKDAGRNRVEFG
ncbi:diguanylate cyclase [Stutzerimonas stutzeri]|uniref:diguanylate cyclase n=1 Tax=Stutzerimonas sp. S1 TaxID=3030652 RepID=UPI0022259607|nr:diguanylate cyclase [Stutzerimonas sp. S1]MCW3147549.1 diguanylate cyclase [Stutzerimonas sp. S1]